MARADALADLPRWPSIVRCRFARKPPPGSNSEPILTVICESVDRLVEEAYQSVCNDRINVFDQSRINSFLQRPRAADRPLMVKLQNQRTAPTRTSLRSSSPSHIGVSVPCLGVEIEDPPRFCLCQYYSNSTMHGWPLFSWHGTTLS